MEQILSAVQELGKLITEALNEIKNAKQGIVKCEKCCGTGNKVVFEEGKLKHRLAQACETCKGRAYIPIEEILSDAKALPCKGCGHTGRVKASEEGTGIMILQKETDHGPCNGTGWIFPEKIEKK